jgi:predicted GNAT family N-acyltransferase
MSIEIGFVKSFSDLSTYELYEILRARNEVFVVGQDCVYQGIDGLDEKSFHIVIPFEGKLGAYCRILPAGLNYPECSTGRVLSSKQARGRKLGHRLMETALQTIRTKAGGKSESLHRHTSSNFTNPMGSSASGKSTWKTISLILKRCGRKHKVQVECQEPCFSVK